MNPMREALLSRVLTVMAAGGGGGGGPRPPAVKAPKKSTRPVVTPHALIRATPRSKSSGKGGGYGSTGGGYQGGGGVGSSRSGSISYSAPPPPPKPPSLADFLAKDSAYSTQKSSLAKAKADYAAQQQKAQTQYLTGYASDADTLKQNRAASLADLENDYAGRGMMNSGLYADSLATTNNDWDKRTSALEAAKAAFLSGLTDDATNFSQEQLIALQKAEAEAAARRAAQYGI